MPFPSTSAAQKSFLSLCSFGRKVGGKGSGCNQVWKGKNPCFGGLTVLTSGWLSCSLPTRAFLLGIIASFGLHPPTEHLLWPLHHSPASWLEALPGPTNGNLFKSSNPNLRYKKQGTHETVAEKGTPPPQKMAPEAGPECFDPMRSMQKVFN